MITASKHIGVNMHPFWSQSAPSTWCGPWLDEVQQAGLTAVRFDLDWRAAKKDYLVEFCDMLTQRSLVPIACLATMGQVWEAPDPWKYAVSAAKVAAALPPGSIIELWNEPNMDRFWKGGADATAYAHMVYLAYHAIKRVNYDIRVAAGAMVWRDVEWLGKFMSAEPAPQFDLFSFHPYTGDQAPDRVDDPWFSPPILVDTLETLMPTTKLMVSEIGFRTESGLEDAKAASYYRAMCQIMYGHVEILCANHLGDRAQNPEVALLRPHLQHTLAWQALADNAKVWNG